LIFIVNRVLTTHAREISATYRPPPAITFS
jgi:hypothetical protein